MQLCYWLTIRIRISHSLKVKFCLKMCLNKYISVRMVMERSDNPILSHLLFASFSVPLVTWDIQS